MANEPSDTGSRPNGQEAQSKPPAQKKRTEGVVTPPTGTFVMIDGVRFDPIGSFRADNTFVEVKRGHCPEGVTLIAIDRPH